jgi:Na+/phosphate symporter
MQLRYAPLKFKLDEGVVYHAVKQNGLALSYAPEKLRRHEEIVLNAVKQDGLAIQYADDKLKKLFSVAKAALNQTEDALKYIDPTLVKSNKTIAKMACEIEDYKLNYFSRGLKKDRGFVEEMTERDPDNIQ